MIAWMVVYYLLGPALTDARIELARGLVIHRLQDTGIYWAWIGLFLSLVMGSLACSMWSFRGVVLCHRCMRCEKP